MKHKSFSFLLALLMSMAANVAMAYDAQIDGIYYNFSGDEATVTYKDGYNSYSGSIVIPETVTYNGVIYSVTSIGDQAFYGCSGLTSVTIPNSVNIIGNSAFVNCFNLTFVAIPDSVISIGNNAFTYSGLTSVTIPNGVINIDYHAFFGCSSLKTVTIPRSVISIGVDAFWGCGGLISIKVETGNESYDSRNDCNAIIETATNTLIAGCQNTIIPNSVTCIGRRAFSGRGGLTSITIPSSVTLIGDETFYGCSGLTSIKVENGNTTYDSRNDCNAIIETSTNTLIVGCQNTIIPNNVTSIGNFAFSCCSGLSSVTIPDGVTSIGNHAFSYCPGLTSITIPNGVTSIGESVFDNCLGLTSITIPNSVTSIGSSAFHETAWYNNHPDGLVYAGMVAYKYKGTMPEGTRITIEEGTLGIAGGAFRYCNGLTAITIPESVTSIGYAIFDGCFSLTSIKVGMKAPISINHGAFSTIHGDATLYVPKGSKEAYEATFPWSCFGNIVECNYVDAEDMSIAASNSSTMEINVNNFETNIVGFQMDLTLPEGVSIDKTGCSLSSRITDENQELTIGKLEDGTYRLTSTSLSLTPISGNDGTLLTLKLTAEDGSVGGQATISNIRFSTSDSEKIIMSDESFDINILYDLIYMVDGEEYKTTSIVYGTTLTPEDYPTKEGHTFHLNGELPATMPNHDVVVTGTFSVNSYTLTYNVDGEEYKTSSVAYGTAITPEEEPIKEGYTFSGWSEIPETMPANDVTVTGTFTINSYTLTYILDGEVYKTESVVYGTPLEPEPTLAKNGYTFSGWSEIPETMPAHDVTITGSFTINSYTLTYMLNDEVYRTETVVYGTPLTPEPALLKEGYTFSGWSAIPETMPAHDVIVTGTLTVNSYTITYIVDNEVYKVVTVDYGTSITPEPTPQKEGHTFSGWSEIPTTMPANDVTVTGTFTINSYTLTYLLDGEVYKTESVVYGTTIMPEVEPTKEGYTFSGWSEQPETMPANDVTVTGAFYLYGDVNTDNEVDVVDVVDIARYVVATPSVKFREKLADLNFDNSVNIADAVTLVNYIAGDQNFVKALTPSGLSYDYDQCQLQLLSAGQNALSLCLDGEADFTAFQFEVDVPDGTDISAISINGTRKDGHQLLYNKLDENRYRVTALSLSNAVFKGSEGELLQFSINGQVTDDICVHDIHFVTTSGRDITFDALYISGTETGIANMNVNGDNDAIYDLLGRKLSKVQHGVNIVNGRKVMVNK